MLAERADRIAFGSLVAFGLLGPVSQGLQETTLGIAVIAWLVSLALGRRMPQRTAAWLPLLLWFLVAALSIVNSVNLHASLGGLRKIVRAVSILAVAAETIRTERRLVAVLTATLAGAALISLDGLGQVLSGSDFLFHHIAGEAPGGLRRLAATFGHPNDFGIYAVSILPACVAVACSGGASSRLIDSGGTRHRIAFAIAKAIRRAAWPIIGLLGVALLCTFSRPSVVAVTVSFTALLILRRAWRTLGLCAAAGVIGLLCLPAPIREWAAAQPSWFDALVQPLRKEIWQAALNMIAAHPFIGVGVNTFVLNYARYKLPMDTIQSAYAHNHYLHMAAEIGLIGLAAFVFLLVRAAGAWRELLRSSAGRMTWLLTGVGCGVVAFLAIGLLESALYSARTNAFFWVWLGVLFGMASSQGLDSSTGRCV